MKKHPVSLRQVLKSIAVIIVLTVLSMSCSDKIPERGTLTGNVTIGPLCPVEPCDMTPEQIEFAYSERKIYIHPARNTSLLVKEVDVHYDRPYSVDLLPGTYIVDINHIGMDRSGDVPARITIRPNVTDTLDIDIDTGIR